MLVEFKSAQPDNGLVEIGLGLGSGLISSTRCEIRLGLDRAAGQPGLTRTRFVCFVFFFFLFITPNFSFKFTLLYIAIMEL